MGQACVRRTGTNMCQSKRDSLLSHRERQRQICFRGIGTNVFLSEIGTETNVCQRKNSQTCFREKQKKYIFLRENGIDCVIGKH